jgi:hypothetical protein
LRVNWREEEEKEKTKTEMVSRCRKLSKGDED